MKVTGSATLHAAVYYGQARLSPLAVKAGAYTLVVADSSTVDNFHIVGKAVNRKTSINGKRSESWKIVLRPGVYRFGSDRTGKLTGRLTVTS